MGIVKAKVEEVTKETSLEVVESTQPVLDLAVVTAEILMLKQQVAGSLVEIGKRLIQVKENLGHGEWLPWLEEKVSFSDQQARRLMKIAKECANSPTLLNLPQSKVFAILELPIDQREEFANNVHVLPSGKAKAVADMSAREVAAAVKAQKEAESRAAAAEAIVKKLTAEKGDLITENGELKGANKTLAQDCKKMTEAVALLEKKVGEAKKGGDSEEVKKLNEALQKAKTELTTMNEALKAAENAVPKDIECELNDLRAKVDAFAKKPMNPQNEAVMKYRFCFENLVESFQKILQALQDIQQHDVGEYEKYKKTIEGLAEKMFGQLK